MSTAEQQPQPESLEQKVAQFQALTNEVKHELDLNFKEYKGENSKVLDAQLRRLSEALKLIRSIPETDAARIA